MNFSKTGIAEAKRKLDSWYRALDDNIKAEDISSFSQLALADDLNTPKAIAELDALATRARTNDTEAKKSLKSAAKMLGLLQQDPEVWFKGSQNDKLIENLIATRLEARKNKNFAESDRIRDELTKQGIILEDNIEGTSWRRR